MSKDFAYQTEFEEPYEDLDLLDNDPLLEDDPLCHNDQTDLCHDPEPSYLTHAFVYVPPSAESEYGHYIGHRNYTMKTVAILEYPAEPGCVPPLVDHVQEGTACGVKSQVGDWFEVDCEKDGEIVSGYIHGAFLTYGYTGDGGKWEYTTDRWELLKKLVDDSDTRLLNGLNLDEKKMVIMILRGLNAKEVQILLSPEGEKIRQKLSGQHWLSYYDRIRAIAPHQISFWQKLEFVNGEITQDQVDRAKRGELILRGHTPYKLLREALIKSTDGSEVDALLQEKYGLDNWVKVKMLTQEDFENNQLYLPEPDEILGDRVQDLEFDPLVDSTKVTFDGIQATMERIILCQSVDEVTEEDETALLNWARLQALKKSYEFMELSEKGVQKQKDLLFTNELKTAGVALAREKKTVDRLKFLDAEIYATLFSIGSTSSGSRGMAVETIDILKSHLRVLENERDDLELNLRRRLVEHSILFIDKEIDLVDLFDSIIVENGFYIDRLKNLFMERIAEVVNSINETRKNLESDPELVWKLELVMEYIMMEVGIFGSSIPGEIIKSKIDSVNRKDTLIGLGLLALSLGVAILSWGTLTPLMAVIGLGVSALDFAYTYDQYKWYSNASNTAFDPQYALSNQDMSFLWVLVSLVAVFIDIGMVRGAFRASAALKNAKRLKEMSRAERLAHKKELVRILREEVGLADDVILRHLQSAVKYRNRLFAVHLTHVPDDVNPIFYAQVVELYARLRLERGIRGANGALSVEDLLQASSRADFENFINSQAFRAGNLEEFATLRFGEAMIDQLFG